VIWEPSREFVEQANVWRFMTRLGFGRLEDFLAFSRDNPERFWDEIMREMGVEWFEPYHQVLDSSRGPEWAQWFVGGRLNIAHNCLDRWAASGRVACIWEGENGATRTITFRELREEANRVANGLVVLGLQPGDRVAMCMPMVPEILSILYGCFKAGLTVVPIFAGFGSGAIATRLEDSGARVLFKKCRAAFAPSSWATARSSPISPPKRLPHPSIPKPAPSSSTLPAPPANPKARFTRTPGAWRKWARKSGWPSTTNPPTAFSGSPTSAG
jgi:hypothetical protein